MGKGKKQDLTEPAVELAPAPSIGEQIAEEQIAARNVQEVLGSDKTDFAQYIIPPDSVPQSLIDRYPVLFDKVFAISNLTEKDTELFKHLLELSIVTDKIFSGAHYERTCEDVKEDIMLRAFFNAQFRRSKGGNTRERMAFNTHVTVSEKGEQIQASGGITNKVKKWFA